MRSPDWTDTIERAAGSEHQPVRPDWRGVGGVPFCSEECYYHDGKRCRILGQRPGTICEPAVEAMGSVLATRNGDK